MPEYIKVFAGRGTGCRLGEKLLAEGKDLDLDLCGKLGADIAEALGEGPVALHSGAILKLVPVWDLSEIIALIQEGMERGYEVRGLFHRTEDVRRGIVHAFRLEFRRKRR